MPWLCTEAKWDVMAGAGLSSCRRLGPPELPELLTALKQCLDESAIAAVKVELDGQAYAMEGLT